MFYAFVGQHSFKLIELQIGFVDFLQRRDTKLLRVAFRSQGLDPPHCSF